MGGFAVLPYDFDFGILVASLIIPLLFSYIFVWFASELSEALGHNAYLSGEDFLIRGFRVFLIWLVVYLVASAVFYSSIPFSNVVVFFISLISVYASVVTAIDGYSIFGAYVEAVKVIVDQIFHVLEFVVLSSLVILPIFLIDITGGFFGTVVSTILITFAVIPWLTAHTVLTYLYRFPLVVATLDKFEES